MACAMEIKRRLSNLNKTEEQFVDLFPHKIRLLADILAAINHPLLEQELVGHTTTLDKDYNNS